MQIAPVAKESGRCRENEGRKWMGWPVSAEIARDVCANGRLVSASCCGRDATKRNDLSKAGYNVLEPRGTESLTSGYGQLATSPDSRPH